MRSSGWLTYNSLDAERFRGPKGGESSAKLPTPEFKSAFRRPFLGRDEAWSLLSSRKEIACWLGKISRFSLKEGKTYKTDTKFEGEIRVVKPGNRVRLTWQKPGMKRPATLQIALERTREDIVPSSS